MLFNTSEYYAFLLLIVSVYYVLPFRYRWILLLFASYFFYLSWRLEYGLLLLISTAIDYYAGLQMSKYDSKKARRPFLYLSLLANLGLLCTFKYFGFLNEVLRYLLSLGDIHLAAPGFSILLPIGISFYTFQSLSYTIDIYRGVQKPERHFGIFALYISFFPQLVSGPIERSKNLLPQFRKKHKLNILQIKDGLKLILWGLFLKLILADQLAEYVNQVFRNPDLYKGLPSLTAIYFFAIQVYGDFAGYTNIAIGSAMLLGFKLSDNFRLPYLARSIQDFWSRWHITLTTWMRDYVYISLGGNRKGKWRNHLNLYLVFLAVAIWHGTDTKLIIFGSLHFLYYLLYRTIKPFWIWSLTKIGLRENFIFKILLPIFITFHLVAFTWVVWWADSWAKVKMIISNVFVWQDYTLTSIFNEGTSPQMVICLIMIVFTIFIYGLQGSYPERTLLNHRPTWLRWGVLYLIIFALLFLSNGVHSEAFIYFQF